MLSDLWFRVRCIARRERVERELNDELQFHLRSRRGNRGARRFGAPAQNR